MSDTISNNHAMYAWHQNRLWHGNLMAFFNTDSKHKALDQIEIVAICRKEIAIYTDLMHTLLSEHGQRNAFSKFFFLVIFFVQRDFSIR